MPKRIAALAVLLVLTLTGCAGAPGDAGESTPAPVGTASASPSAAPTPSATPEAVPTVSVATTPEEEAYLAVTLPDLAGWGTVLTEQEALDAGRFACEQIAALPAGHTIIDRYEIQPLPGDTEAANSVIVREAITHFCP